MKVEKSMIQYTMRLQGRRNRLLLYDFKCAEICSGYHGEICVNNDIFLLND